MLVQNSIGSCLQVKSSAQTGTQAAATAIPPGGCLVCHLVDGTGYAITEGKVTVGHVAFPAVQSVLGWGLLMDPNSKFN